MTDQGGSERAVWDITDEQVYQLARVLTGGGKEGDRPGDRGRIPHFQRTTVFPTVLLHVLWCIALSGGEFTL